ncbi:MAG: hypothetical protein JRI44_11765 [Deltaproteobacteria bacterium]|nr:hypothetical protein [Deltaproteobacteria bacterium]
MQEKKPKIVEFIPYFVKFEDEYNLTEEKFMVIKEIKKKMSSKKGALGPSFWHLFFKKRAALFKLQDFLWTVIIPYKIPQIHLFLSKKNRLPLYDTLKFLYWTTGGLFSGGGLFHSAAISTKSGAIIFLGRSGAGKTTLSNLWNNRGGYILSDDANVVYLDEKTERYMVYPLPVQFSPWKKPIKYAVPLVGMGVLEKSLSNKIVSIDKKSIYNQLKESHSDMWKIVFPTQKWPDILEKNLNNLVDKIPSFIFKFKNDISAADFLKQYVERNF